jgi:DnaJ-class molecular chaperone
MNSSEAKEILELPDDFTEEHLKKNYRRLAKKYHPDKSFDKNSDKFVQIQQAYEFFTEKTGSTSTSNIFENFADLFTSFKQNSSFKQNFSFKQNIFKEILITPKEYFMGCTKNFTIPLNCKCKQELCKNCIGCGYSLNELNLETCMECLGDGTIKICDCKNLRVVDIIIQPMPNIETNIAIPGIGKIKIKINDPKYIFQKDKLYYTFDISLKESLTGFSKNFKDPLGETHEIIIKNTLIKQNDGYSINVGVQQLILLFNIIYPKQLNKKIRQVISNFDF